MKSSERKTYEKGNKFCRHFGLVENKWNFFFSLWIVISGHLSHCTRWTLEKDSGSIDLLPSGGAAGDERCLSSFSMFGQRSALSIPLSIFNSMIGSKCWETRKTENYIDLIISYPDRSPGCRFPVTVIYSSGRSRKLTGWRSGSGRWWRVWFVGFVANDLIHKGNVSDGQTEGFDPRQTFLIGERWHFASQLVKRFVQVEHATSLADVGRTTLRHGRHSFPFLGRRRWQTATSGRVISIYSKYRGDRKQKNIDWIRGNWWCKTKRPVAAFEPNGLKCQRDIAKSLCFFCHAIY